jgi:hypothetical protein
MCIATRQLHNPMPGDVRSPAYDVRGHVQWLAGGLAGTTHFGIAQRSGLVLPGITAWINCKSVVCSATIFCHVDISCKLSLELRVRMSRGNSVSFVHSSPLQSLVSTGWQMVHHIVTAYFLSWSCYHRSQNPQCITFFITHAFGINSSSTQLPRFLVDNCHCLY